MDQISKQIVLKHSVRIAQSQRQMH